MAIIHISEADATRDLAGIMARVYAGEEIVIDNGSLTVAMVPSAIPSRRSVAECIAFVKRHEEETGQAPVLDSDFAADVKEIVQNRKPWNPPAWD
jgi:antitoxin (DNA-binding transcriptional repressor) of toxin-antitoxin stability system